MTWKPALTTSRRSLGEQVFRGVYAVVAVMSVGLIVGVIFLGIGLAQGYRPVVLTSGSMTPTAPVGSVVVARPVESVQVGDILVMSNEARATVTHRVVEIETSSDGQVFAVTRGDANEEVDAEPFALNGPQLVGRWVVPGLGSALLWLGSPLIGLAVIGGAVLVITMSTISHIWGSSGSPSVQQDAEGGVEPGSLGQKRFGLGVGLAVLFGFTGLAWSLYLSADSVAGNAFSTSDCFDARLAGVQSGQVTSTSDGITSVPITAVVPSASFVTYSVRSNSTRPGDAIVLGNLSNATTIEFVRQTGAGARPPIIIEWSVVEYACGVTVQRGSGTGNATSAVDFAIADVDPASSFVLGGSVADPTNGQFGGDDVQIAELVGTDTVRFRTAGDSLDVDRLFSFQLVEFDNAGDVAVEVVTGTVPIGSTTETFTLAQPVATDATMIIGSFASSNTATPVAQRLTRARLVGGSTVEVQRVATGRPIEVSLQVVQFLDGTTVQHGVVDLLPAQTSATVPINPVDLARSTVGSTVLVGGANSGGSTDHVPTELASEALVTASFSDAATVAIERTPSASTSSFAWQVVTWGGPSWADNDAPYRQRIDVDAQSVDVPSGYTTPVVIDHTALISSGLSSASGNDLRLWRFDGAAWSELDRVLDENSSWNSIGTTFWFRTREAVSASTTVSYWLYFGDPTPAAPLDDPANVWLIDEGFESGLGVFEDRTEGTAWYRAEPWTRRIELTVSAAAVASPLTDQAVLVRVANPSLASSAQTDGSDLFFTNAGGSRIPHDIEAWDSTTGTLSAWVDVDVLDDSSDTTLFLYYGAPDAPAQADQRATWSGDGVVWNMSSNPAGPSPSLDDRGPGNNDGVALGDTQRVEVPTGFAARLDGTTDRLEAAPLRLPDGALTVSAWFRADAISGDVVLVAQGDPSAGGVLELGIDNTTSPGSPVARAALNLDGVAIDVAGGAIAPATWHHLAMVWDQATIELFVDGASTVSIAAPGSLPSSRTTAVVLGGDPSGAQTLDGDLGQVRVRFAAISPAQLGFEATNLLTPTTTVAFGSPVSGAYRDQGDWAIRRPILVSAAMADADVTDFPLLVQLVDSGFGAAQGDGDDLVFTAADGVTRLDHYVEAWDGSTGTLTAWVRLPLLSSTVDTELLLYLDNSSAGSQNDPIGVWGEESNLVILSP